MSADRIARLDALFARPAAAAEPGCAALLLDRGEVVWRTHQGLAHLAARRPIDAQTRFRVCSITKPMFALALAALEGQGVLSFDDPLARYVPELRIAHRPTLAHAMGMKSGIFETYPLTWLALGPAAPQGVRLDQVLGLQLAQTRTNFAPGERTLYSNTNYLLLQLAAERASGLACGELLRRYVFDPAGMAGAALADGPAARLRDAALAYAKAEDGFAPDDPDVAFGASGAVVATIDDMAAWWRWLRTDPYGWRARLAGPSRHRDGGESAYGLGFARHRISGRLALGHSGGASSWLCDTMWMADEDVAAVVLGNRSDINWIERTREMLTIWTGIAPDPAAAPRLCRPAAPEPLWTATYGDEASGASVTLRGAPGEVECDGRPYPRAEDGLFRRSVGVEPISLRIEGDLLSAPASIVRREGDVEARMVLADPATAPALAGLVGTYGHPDLPEPLRLWLEEGELKLAVGAPWPSGAPLVLRHVVGRLFHAYDAQGVAQELHLAFELGADGEAVGATASFLRITAYPLSRLSRTIEEGSRRFSSRTAAMMAWRAE
ncbi:serine hydrolase domain-containing protein [Phenylobacterium sp.]|uniref:serine hydrolase domain-containing protein n=1 Tax=Phenylobacterium sp. TaxID=1871053 RepID=UPI0035B09C3B